MLLETAVTVKIERADTLYMLSLCTSCCQDVQQPAEAAMLSAVK